MRLEILQYGELRPDYTVSPDRSNSINLNQNHIQPKPSGREEPKLDARKLEINLVLNLQ